MSTTLLQAARASIRGSLCASHATLLAVGLAAGLAPNAAHAWGTDYQTMGRALGSELGSLAGGVFSPTARIASAIGGVIGQQIGKPFDDAGQYQRRAEDIQRQAREQALRDAAYDAERRRLDPSYMPQARYGDMTTQADRSINTSRAIAATVAGAQRGTPAEVDDHRHRDTQSAP
jgi:hypothetical protein